MLLILLPHQDTSVTAWPLIRLALKSWCDSSPSVAKVMSSSVISWITPLELLPVSMEDWFFLLACNPKLFLSVLVESSSRLWSLPACLRSSLVTGPSLELLCGHSFICFHDNTYGYSEKVRGWSLFSFTSNISVSMAKSRYPINGCLCPLEQFKPF